MEARTLSNFIAVAEEKNLRRAAMRLHITQPALSRQIQALEEEIGTALFTRSVNGMELTPAGESLLHHARNIKMEIELAKRDVLRTTQQQRKQLDVGVSGSAMFNIIPEILEQFSKLHPDVDLVLHTARKEQQMQALRHGKILIAFERFLHEEADLACEEVISEPMLLALHKDHPLANQPVIDIRTLRDELFIGGPADKSAEDQFFQSYGYRRRIEKRVNDLMSGLNLVGCGYGLFYAPPSVQSLQIRNVVYRPYLGGGKRVFTLHCQYCKNENSPLLHAMLEVVRAYRAAHSD
ncbi:MAG: LysR family transcriptional regulator [Proteobacteria bacterium]|nr:LysR family transcriptional regulator [Pseudomonadota bacterium]